MKYKKLEDCAVVEVGQILSRVTDDMEQSGEEVVVLSPKAIVDGAINKIDLKDTYLIKYVSKEKYTKEGDVVIKLSSPYDAAFIYKEFENLLIPSFIAAIRVKSEIVDAHYIAALLNSKYVREQLQNLQIGAARPMIRVSELRKIEIPNIPMEEMKKIGEEYRLSCEKRQVLTEMIEVERDIMEYAVLKSTMEG